VNKEKLNRRFAISVITMDSRFLSLLQWCDSNFPSGAFSHSFGLETYIQEEKVHNKATFADWLRVFLDKQLVYTDGLACRITYEALEQNDLDQIWSLDRLITVQNVPRESREGSRKIGERMTQLGTVLISCPFLVLYQERIRSKQSFGHPSIVFAMMAFHLQIPKQTAILAFLYTCLSSLVQNGVRGIPLGQTDGQLLLAELQSSIIEAAKYIEDLDYSDLGVVSPGLEMAQMRHERLHIRLFMS
jgi:urease accessory protein